MIRKIITPTASEPEATNSPNCSTTRPAAPVPCCAFVRISRVVAAISHRLRCLAMDQADRSDVFDEAGFPVGGVWDEIDFPNLDDPHAYALEVHGDELLPTYRDGDLLIASPVASIRRRDRVILRTKAGPTLAGTLLRRTAQRIEVASFARDLEPQVLPVREVAWLVRILWVSQ